MKNIGIIGCGWLGFHIAKKQSNKNNIYCTTTSENKNEKFNKIGYESILLNFYRYNSNTEGKWNVLNKLNVIIITIPFSKREKFKDIKQKFKNIISFIDGFTGNIFLMSSIGIYPNIEEEITENSIDEKYLNPNILFVEKLMRSKFSKINVLRLGGLMGADRIFHKYKTSELNKIVNHVHYEDICSIIDLMIEKKITGKIYNIVSPLHPTKKEIINLKKVILENNSNEMKYGRKVLSDLSQKDLNYIYIYPDPKNY